MSESSFQDEVLGELGDDKLAEIAALLSTDTGSARSVVAETVGAMSGDLRQKADTDDGDGAEVRQAVAEVTDPPLQGVAAFGGLLGGGMMAGVLTKMSKPLANAVSRKTGIPAATVTRVIEMLIPVVLAVFARRAAAAKGSGPGAGTAGDATPDTAAGAASGSGGFSDLLAQILGGDKK
ncbi:DUF937 domain-containing protein [Streptomyces sp. NPDC015171]|uniref:DUF937 domain-containing protein n=1 Tax=Streptomyces sp. NPDC015171 TaxID=3364945 RepID=UPI0036F6D521